MPVLCYFILSPEGKELLDRARVLEVGAGIGVPGFLAGRCCQQLHLSDNNEEVVARLKHNAKLNAEMMVADEVYVTNLTWGKDQLKHLEDFVGKYNVVLGSDVVYSEGSARALLETVHALLAPGGVMMLAYIPRWSLVGRRGGAAGVVALDTRQHARKIGICHHGRQ